MPEQPFKIALVERGGCDFATKVRAAQERGAGGVVVGDTIAREGESEEEGRERRGLITMFSPGTFTLQIDFRLCDSLLIPTYFMITPQFGRDRKGSEH